MMHVFVYGTLKRGQRNHHLLAGQAFIQAARTQPLYRLHDVGRYPALVERPEAGLSIEGEVYLIDDATRARLDLLENAPILYRLMPVLLLDFTEPAYTYVYNADVSSLPDCGTSWPADPANPPEFWL